MVLIVISIHIIIFIIFWTHLLIYYGNSLYYYHVSVFSLAISLNHVASDGLNSLKLWDVRSLHWCLLSPGLSLFTARLQWHPGGGCFRCSTPPPPHRNSEVLTKLSRIPSSVQNIYITI
jgi:hypothetical protein